MVAVRVNKVHMMCLVHMIEELLCCTTGQPFRNIRLNCTFRLCSIYLIDRLLQYCLTQHVSLPT